MPSNAETLTAELVVAVRESATINWNLKQHVLGNGGLASP